MESELVMEGEGALQVWKARRPDLISAISLSWLSGGFYGVDFRHKVDLHTSTQICQDDSCRLGFWERVNFPDDKRRAPRPAVIIDCLSRARVPETPPRIAVICGSAAADNGAVARVAA